jgi:hypothetical protein
LKGDPEMLFFTVLLSIPNTIKAEIPYGMMLRPSIIIFKTFDIILSKIVAPLDFNKNNLAVRLDIFDSVRGTFRDINSVSGGKGNFPAVKGNDGVTADNVPVFRSPPVPL